MTVLSRPMIASAVSLMLIAACRTPPRVVESVRPSPAMQADTSQTRGPPAHAGGSQSRNSPADVGFMQGMIGHHAQALAMTSLLPTRTHRDDMRLLAQRIDVAQRDEIRQMQRWLRDHHEDVPSADPAHQHHGSAGHRMMPGMLTEEELARLANATGSAFDRLFLEFMIRHHEGALTMVQQLFGINGAAQESEVYQFVTDVDTDQRAEIARMRALLDAIPAP